MKEEIYLYSQKYKITEVDSLRNGEFGFIYHRLNEIQIHPEICLEKRLQVLLHEVLHSISDNNGLDLTESQVESISNGYTDFLLSNKKYVIDKLNEIDKKEKNNE